MTGEAPTASLVGNGIAEPSETEIKPVLGAVAFVETFSKSLRAGFAQKLA